MKTKYIITPLLSACVIFLTGCYSTEVSDSININQSQVYQNYSIDINSETGNADARAVFRFESWQGNTLNLTAPSRITINGKSMTGDKQWLVGHVYTASRVQNDDNIYTWEFFDTNEKKYTNSYKLEPIGFGELPESISISNGGDIKWNGAPIGRDETIRLNIKLADTLSTSITTSLRNGTEIHLNPRDLQQFYPGNANISFEREFNSDLIESTDVEGVLAGIYRGEVKSIKLVE